MKYSTVNKPPLASDQNDNLHFNPMKTGNPFLAKSEGPDEMLHHVSFHQGLHCLLLKTKLIFRERNTISSWKL